MRQFISLLSPLLLFPANLILLAACGLLWQRRQRRGLWLTWLALALLWLFSTRSGALLLLAPLENQSSALISIPANAQAIVVLGGGRRSNAPEYGQHDMPSYQLLARLQYAASLQRQSHLPILVSGGMRQEENSSESEAAIMARSLHDDFGVNAQWQEDRSGNTAENAVNSAAILRQAGLQRILLVTDAIHMPRALASFRHAGVPAIAAPTVFFSQERDGRYDFFPSGEGLRRSNYALHEWVGLLWYKLRSSS